MLIDWFTVFAQIVNFLILVFLLKYFLYDRIIEAMDRREQRIRARLDDAENRKQEAEREREEYRDKNREIDERRREMLAQAAEEAEKHRRELTHKAKEEVDSLRARWHESLRREKSSFLRDFRLMAGSGVYSVSRRTLKELADAELEERVVDVFLSKIQGLPKAKRDAISEAIRDGNGAATVLSGFEMETRLRRKITKSIHEVLAEGVEIDYRHDPDLIMGIELKSRGEKIEWSIEGYLADLEDEAREALEKEAVRRDERSTFNAEQRDKG